MAWIYILKGKKTAVFLVIQRLESINQVPAETWNVMAIVKGE